MRAVLISINPKWCEKIANGEKTIEVRKTRPKQEAPFKVYIYETKGYDTLFEKGKPKKLYVSGGRVIGEFVCDKIDEYKYRLTTYEETPYKGKYISKEELAKTCLSIGEVNDYLNGKNGYLWHISDLKIYDKPKGLSEFEYPRDNIHLSYRKRNQYFKGITRPPQSWCYVEVSE